MHCRNPSGWSLGFAGSSDKIEPTDSDTSQLQEDRALIDVLKVPPGLHCGPAGRRTLIRWLEDNYKLRRGMYNANPGVLACRLWQESQGFKDPVAKAIVELLKLQGIPANVTYKVLYEKYLSKQLSTLIKRSANSQKKLSFLAEKMISMLQVTEIQPLIADVLDLLIEIPQLTMDKLLEDTTSAQQFYKIATVNIKRKIWSASAKRLYYTFEPYISKALFLLQLGIMDPEMSSTSERLAEYNILVSQIVELIGDPQVESSRIVYYLLVHLLKLLFIKSILDLKSDSTIKETTQLSFNLVSLPLLKSSNMDKPPEILYSEYVGKSVGLKCSNLDDINDDFIYTGKGEFLWSILRYSIAFKLQEVYRIPNTEMVLLEPKYHLLHLIQTIQTNNNKLPHDEIKLLLMKKDSKHFKNIKIKDDADLFDVAFILCNPLLSNAIIADLVGSLFDTNMMLLSIQSDINDWLSLLSLGLSASYIGLVKFIIHLESFKRDDGCEYLSFIKPYMNTTKPISLRKVLSYVYPIDKPTNVEMTIPPFFTNFISSDANKLVGNKIYKLQILDEVPSEDISDIIEDDPNTTFHSLLLLYLPKLNIKKFGDFKLQFRLISNLIASSNSDQTDINNTNEIIHNVLGIFGNMHYDSTNYVNNLLHTLERHHSFTKRTKNTSIGQLNFTLLYIVLKKITYLEPSIIMNLFSATANITSILLKLIIVQFLNSSSRYSPFINVFESQLINKITTNTIHYKLPIDYIWLRLARISIQCLIPKFVGDSSTLLINLQHCTVDDNRVVLNRLWKFVYKMHLPTTTHTFYRNCHKSVYTNENRENPSFEYKKWLSTLENLK